MNSWSPWVNIRSRTTPKPLKLAVDSSLIFGLLLGDNLHPEFPPFSILPPVVSYTFTTYIHYSYNILLSFAYFWALLNHIYHISSVCFFNLVLFSKIYPCCCRSQEYNSLLYHIPFWKHATVHLSLLLWVNIWVAACLLLMETSSMNLAYVSWITCADISVGQGLANYLLPVFRRGLLRFRK